MTSSTGVSVSSRTPRVSPSHGPRRAEVIFYEVAQSQLQKMSAAEMVRADRAIVAISVNPWLGDPIGRSPLREYREDSVRVIYTATVLGSVIIVAYLEA